MQKQTYKVSVDPEAFNRFNRIAARLGMTGASLASILVHEYSHVRPEGFFEAVAAVPSDLKARPVGRPVGSASRKETADSAA